MTVSTTEGPPAEGTANDVRPMTGEEYIESLRDGRAIYIYGERVDDVTTHPAFRNAVRSVAALYDSLHEPEAEGVTRVPTDTGNGGWTHPFFKTPRTPEDLIQSRDAIAAWQRQVYGWMGRSPDYKASFLGTLGANADFFAPYQENARRWYASCQERVTYMNHALVNPPIDRSLPADAGEVCMHVVDETDNGLVISGAKVVATGSALTNANFVAHYGLPVAKKEYGAMFTVPMDAPGLKLLSRVSYEMTAAAMGSPFDYPLSSRMDENDAILIMDRTLVPWENVFAYSAEAANAFALGSGWMARLTLHGCTRLAVKLDFIAGCVLKAVKMTGTAGFRGVQAQVGEILNWRDLFWGLSEAMCRTPEPWVDGALQPKTSFGLAYRTFMGTGYARVKEIIEQTLGSGLIYLNSGAADWKNPELRPYLDKYVRGSDGIAAVDRVKLLKLLWDAVGTEFGGRHELYERNYAGNNEAVRFETLMFHQMTGEADRLEAFAEQCMSEYDLDGWTKPGLIDPDDVEVVVNRAGGL